MRKLLEKVGQKLSPRELVSYRANVVEASRRASRLYPSYALLHGELAEASAEIGMYADAVSEAKRALELDKQTPHLDKKLPKNLRQRLIDGIPAWENAATEIQTDPDHKKR